MAQGTGWKSRPATERQVGFIDQLLDERVLAELTDEVLDQIADYQSGITLTGGDASALIDLLSAQAKRPRQWKSGAPVSTRGERVARYQQAKAAADEAAAARDAALSAAGGVAALIGECRACRHVHDIGSRCRSTVQVMSDMWDACGCQQDGPRGDATTEAAVDARKHWWPLQEEADRLWFEADAIRKGDRVVVARGRKVRKGSVGAVLTIRDGAYGVSAFLLLDDGTKVWTALSNLNHEDGDAS